MTTSLETRLPVTASASFSWYLRPRHPLLARAAGLVDALTIAGPTGPTEMRGRRDAGFEMPLIFDGEGYAGKEVPPPREWASLQRACGADRVLLPGVYAPWDRDELPNTHLLTSTVREQAEIARDLDAVLLLALDSRWVARRTSSVLETLGQADVPTALVLADPKDPLAIGGAVSGLRRLARGLPDMMLLRSDHGSIGAVAFGAKHASIGLLTSTRHFVARPMKAHRKRNTSARLFVRTLLDWFLAGDVAGWTAAGSNTFCYLGCCNGADLSRFLDEDLYVDATWHNLNALADFASLIHGVNAEDRGIEFLRACKDAAGRYGQAGFKGPADPKAQLTGWAFI